jgi:hypothetical protein
VTSHKVSGILNCGIDPSRYLLRRCKTSSHADLKFSGYNVTSAILQCLHGMSEAMTGAPEALGRCSAAIFGFAERLPARGHQFGRFHLT